MYGINDLSGGAKGTLENEEDADGGAGGCKICPNGQFSKIGSLKCSPNQCPNGKYITISQAATVIQKGVTIRGGVVSCAACPEGKTSHPAKSPPPSCKGDWHQYSCNSDAENTLSCQNEYHAPDSVVAAAAISKHSKMEYHHHAGDVCANDLMTSCKQSVSEGDEFDFMKCRACAARQKFQSCKWAQGEVSRVCDKMKSQITSAQDRYYRHTEYIPAYLKPDLKQGANPFEAAGAEMGACFLGRSVDIMNAMYALARCHHFKEKNRDHPCSPVLVDDLVKNLRGCCHGQYHVVIHGDETMCKQQVLSVMNKVSEELKPAFDECVHTPQADACKDRRKAFASCKKSGKYPDDQTDCDQAFSAIIGSYKALLAGARALYKQSPKSDITPTASILLEMCVSTWEAEYNGLPAGCVKGKACTFTPLLRDCAENLFTAMKKLRHKECDNPNDSDLTYKC
jgi:hypothetical protein